MNSETIKISFNRKKKKEETQINIAGFPPYTRGNNAMGFLMDLPKIFKENAKEYPYRFLYSEDNPISDGFISSIKNIRQEFQNGAVKEAILVCEISENESVSIRLISLIRAIRTAWSVIQKIENPTPLKIFVQTPFGYHSSLLKVLCSEPDALISNQLSEEILKDFISDFKLLKTIDPFAGSLLIEKLTEEYSHQIIAKINL